MTEVRELDTEETYLAFAAMVELGREVGSMDEFCGKVNRLLRPEGYRLLGAFEPGEEQAVAAAGFRLGHDLVHGSYLYVDDLATRSPFRKRGLAGQLMDWLVDQARRNNCAHLTLESGVHRYDAHRFYLKRGMHITSHHFNLDLRGPEDHSSS